MKTIVTFGSNHLQTVAVNPMSVILVIEADTELKARQIVFDSFIGKAFCTSYPYEPYAEEFNRDYNMKEYTLEQLEEMRT
jgi:hypothetical protein